MKIAVILPAAGSGRRFAVEPSPMDPLADATPATKIEVNLHGRAVFLHAVERFLARPEVGQVILAVHPERLAAFELRHGDRLGFHGVTLIAGGLRERWETVRLALAAVRSDCTHVAIHDAARPLVSDALIGRVFAAAKVYDAVIPGLPVTATLKRTEEVESAVGSTDPIDALLGGAPSAPMTVSRVTQTVDRRHLVEVQTPQVFEISLLRQAYGAIEEQSSATDDASLVEALGRPVHVVEGESTNLKITRPADLALAQALLQLDSPVGTTPDRRSRPADDDDD